MPNMKNRILELVYDKLMDNYFNDQDNFEIEKVSDQSIDFENGIINFDYTIGGIVYNCKLIID